MGAFMFLSVALNRKGFITVAALERVHIAVNFLMLPLLVFSPEGLLANAAQEGFVLLVSLLMTLQMTGV